MQQGMSTAMGTALGSLQKQISITVQFELNGHLITVNSLNPNFLKTIEVLKKQLKKDLKTNGNINLLKGVKL